MVKHYLYIIILSTFICCRNGANTNYKESNKIDSFNFNIKEFIPFPKEYLNDRKNIIRNVSPDINYKYFECVYKDALSDNNRGSVLTYKGDSQRCSSITSTINSDKGFFTECHPGICFFYIVGVRDNDKTDLIDSEEKLKKFIGYINNIEEVLLFSKINGYWYNTDTIISGAYKDRNNDYLLYLLEYSSSPVTYKSVKAILSKTGNFRVIDKTIYKQTNEYIIE